MKVFCGLCGVEVINIGFDVPNDVWVDPLLDLGERLFCQLKTAPLGMHRAEDPLISAARHAATLKT